MNTILWIVQILAALVFLWAGGAKLVGAESMIQAFAQLGLGQWFRYLTGVLEVAGAVVLLTPKWSAFGALLLSCVMVGAIVSLLTRLTGSLAPASVLLVLLLFVIWGRQEQIKALF